MCVYIMVCLCVCMSVHDTVCVCVCMSVHDTVCVCMMYIYLFGFSNIVVNGEYGHRAFHRDKEREKKRTKMREKRGIQS